MKRSAAIFSTLLVTTALAASQPAPFDMSNERATQPQAVAPAPEQAPVAPPEPETPPVSAAPVQPAAPVSPPAPAAPARSSATAPIPVAQRIVTNDEPRRFLVPSDKLSLNGEIDRKQWTVQLTAEEARTASLFHLGYQSAVVVAPEISRIRIFLNGISVVDQPVRSPEGISDIVVPVPPDVLRPGANVITVEASQRHRTDCTIQSTYELWSEIAPERTYLSFGENGARRMANFEDVATIGVDEGGETRFNIIAPGGDVPAATKPLLRLAEGLAVYANMPNQRVAVSRSANGVADEGALNIVVGLPGEVASVVDDMPDGATVTPTITFVDDPQTGPGTMIVTGPTWSSIASAVENVLAPVDRPVTTQRTSLSTQAWHYPDAPIFFGAGQQDLSKLGFKTQEFAGRRFRTDFVIGVPSDFYARDYGEARLLLDAAYTAEVQPGSHLDIYVNGNIAATVPITNRGGAILRKLPVKVTMRHFRPGANTISIEAVLLTDADATCAPGATANEASRFVLFDTTQFQMPRFARMAQLPNLERVAGTGFPYNLSQNPVPLVLAGGGFETLSTAATLLAKMALSAGRPIAIEPVTTPQQIGERDALFFGPVARFQPEVLSQVGLSPDSRIAWGEQSTPVANTVDLQQTTATLDKWTNQLSSSGWRSSLVSFREWLKSKFDLSSETLQLVPQSATAFTPPSETSFLIAQRPAPDGDHMWTLVTAPTAEALWAGAEGLARTVQWNKIGGEMTLYNGTLDDTTTRPVSTYTFRETQPFSIANYRLILANWLSGNVLSYAAALFVVCMLLGTATASLLQNLGRRR